jgi:hypothetical protein
MFFKKTLDCKNLHDLPLTTLLFSLICVQSAQDATQLTGAYKFHRCGDAQPIRVNIYLQGAG